MVLHLFLFLFLFIPSVSFLQLLPTLKTLQILQNQYKIYPPPTTFSKLSLITSTNNHSPSEMRECFDNNVALIIIPCIPV